MRAAQNPSPGNLRCRRGAAAVEFAILLPVLTLLLVIVVDFSRLFYHYTIVSNCARNGALYASDDTAAVDSPYHTTTPNATAAQVLSDRATSVQKAALADAVLPPNVPPDPPWTATLTEDTSSRVAVRVSYKFNLITSYLGTGPITISRTVWMNKAPPTPN